METIPENSREIATARSYGDLRENFEYQAAKDRQRQLMQRQKELEQDLKEVQGTDFAEQSAADRVGPGTCARLAGPDGCEHRVCILGEWDRDEALGIVACGSALAKALEGARSGDTVETPGGFDSAQAEGGAHIPCRVLSVENPPPEVHEWIRSRSDVVS